MTKTENIDNNKYKINFSVTAERFEEGLNYSYNKNKNHFKIQGFRKGKVPRKMVESMYGVEVLFDDAINFVLQEAYVKAAKESGLEIVSKPEIDVVSASVKDGVVFSAVVYTKPEVTISEYKNLTYTDQNVSVNKDDVEEELNKIKEKHSRINPVKDRAIKKGDLANINFEGFIDGIAFEGGKGENFDLEIGSKTFIDNFEEQLIGKNIGDEIEVNVTFPSDYNAKDLADKKAMFKVKINEINEKILPKIDDQFVQDTTEFETLSEYKKDIKSKLTSAKKAEAEKAIKEELITSLIEKAKMEIPEAMIELEIDNKINQFANGIMSQGISLQNYLNYMGQSIENMREAYRFMCERQIKSRLTLEKIAELEKIKVSDKDIQNELTKIASKYNIEKEKLEQYLSEEEKEAIIKDLKIEKTLDFIVKNAKKSS